MQLGQVSLVASSLLAAFIASNASAQVTLVSQSRSVRADGCTPPSSQSQSAPNFGPFSAGAFVNCASGPFGVGQANQTSSLSTSQITCTQTATALGNAGSDNMFQVVFDVASTVQYTFDGMTNRANFNIALVGPSGDVFPAVSNTTFNTAGTLAPGRYTLTSNMFGQSGSPQPSSSLTMNFTSLGSCCLASGSCSITTQANCAGVWTLGGNCANPCPPNNDNCANAFPIDLNDTPFTTINATTDGPTPQQSCIPTFPDFLRDVWYRYTPVYAGDLTVSTCGSANYDTKIAAYTGTCGSLSLIACGEDECGIQSQFTTHVAAGVPVLIRVGGYADFAVGSGVLHLSQTIDTPYRISWYTLDAGGGNANSANGYSTMGTIGQCDAALPILTSVDGYRTTLGYWARDPGTPPCLADFDDGSFTGQPDGGVTIDDLLYYLELFRQGSATADVDDGTFTGSPDGGVTVDDLLYYLDRYSVGC